jgi:hypothetical protein
MTMIPRRITDRIAQRVAETAVVGALAIGLATPMLIPPAALAAPAAAPVSGARKPDLVPSYAGSYSGGYDGIPLEGRVTIWPTVRNTGGEAAHGVRMVVSIPAQMTDVTISQGYFSCSSHPGTRGKTVIACDTDGDLEPNEVLGIEIHGLTAMLPGNPEVVVAIDPDNAVGESDELNNTKVSPLVTN